jgi:hypothetical protein
MTKEIQEQQLLWIKQSFLKEITTSSNVDLKNKDIVKFCDILNQYNNDIYNPIRLICMNGYGIKFNCFNNTANAVQVLGSDWERRIGYNITDYKTRSDIGIEIHCVLKHKPTNTYYDITPDYAGEKYKWFIDSDILTNKYMRTMVLHNRKIDRITSKNKSAKFSTFEELDKTLQFLKKTMIVSF